MEVVHEQCAGLDVHKKTVVACALTAEGRQTRTFPTTTRRLKELAGWLEAKGVTHVAMESTGSYWKPVWNILEEETGCELLLVNAKHVKQVPGRKTDVKDAEWLAELLRHGLLPASCVPSRPQRELRELVRYRRSLIRERTREVQRLQKVLEGANIKLASVISDVTGLSGKAMVLAMIRGETDPGRLADLASPRLKATREQLLEALEGKVGEHQRALLGSLVRHIDFLDAEIERLDGEVAGRMERMDPLPPQGGAASGLDPSVGLPGAGASSREERGLSRAGGSGGETVDELSYSMAIEFLDEIPGIGVRSAEDLLAEVGLDMTRFPNADHFCSWAKVCPGNNESGGKRRSGRTGRGNPWLRSTLTEIAWAAARRKGCYYSALYHRLAGRRGKKRAIMAVARSILEAIYHMLSRRQRYQELGGDYLDWLRREKIKRHAVARLCRLGYQVQILEDSLAPSPA